MQLNIKKSTRCTQTVMAEMSSVSFQMDCELKLNIEQVCSDMGLSLTTAFTLFAKTVTRESELHLR